MASDKQKDAKANKQQTDKQGRFAKIKEVDRKASVIVFWIFFISLSILLVYHWLPDASDKSDFMGMLLIAVGALGIWIRSEIKKRRKTRNNNDLE